MTDEKIIEALARLDGEWQNNIAVISNNLGNPDYINSHDAVQRIIDGMDDETLVEYSAHVGVVVTNDTLRGSSMSDSDIAWLILKCCLKSTPRQKCKAILKVYGKWEGEE